MSCPPRAPTVRQVPAQTSAGTDKCWNRQALTVKRSLPRPSSTRMRWSKASPPLGARPRRLSRVWVRWNGWRSRVQSSKPPRMWQMWRKQTSNLRSIGPGRRQLGTTHLRPPPPNPTHLRRRLRVGPVELLPVLLEGEGADLLVHAVEGDLRVGQLGDAVQVVGRARRDAPEDDLLRHAPSERHAHLVEHLLAAEERNLFGQELVVPEGRGAAGDDGDLEQRVGVLEEPAADGVAGLVVGHRPALLRAEDLALLLDAADDALDRRLKVPNVHFGLVAARRDQRRLVADVGDVRPREARRERRHAARNLLHVVRQLDVLEMHHVDLQAALDVGLVDADLAVEAARAQQGGVEDVHPVGAREDDDARERVEAVHLHQQLVQRVLPLVVAATEAALATSAADSVDLVDEDDARRVGARLAEEVAHARSAHAHEHLDEVRTRHGEEGHAGLARHGLGQQRLARAGGAAQQRALGDLGAEVLELFRLLQEVDKFHNLHLSLGQTRHVLERHLLLLVPADDGGLRLVHAEDAARAARAAAAAARRHLQATFASTERTTANQFFPQLQEAC
mmetsp:Transcript_52523/g.137703  ORF Transcript_52523/g.137703 Transcript_52523/m.137703 type:complete len:564 (+) Transcript_52523:392-2083(+)